MSRRTQRPTRRHRHASVSRPDFAHLYAEIIPTPRMAHALWRAAKQLTDEWRGSYDDPDDYDDLLVDLPRCVGDVAGRSWMQWFAGCLQDVRLAVETASLERLPTCVGDELALFLVFDRAGGEAFLWALDNDPYHQQLPSLAGDEWYFGVAGTLFPDTGIVHLLESQADGGVYDDPIFNRQMAGATPASWFASLARHGKAPRSRRE